MPRVSKKTQTPPPTPNNPLGTALGAALAKANVNNSQISVTVVSTPQATPEIDRGEGTGENDPARYCAIEKAVEELNKIVNIDSSAVKVLLNNHQVPCAAEMEDVKGISVKVAGWGDKYQVFITALTLVNAAVYGLTGKNVAVEFDSDNKPKFVIG